MLGPHRFCTSMHFFRRNIEAFQKAGIAGKTGVKYQDCGLMPATSFFALSRVRAVKATTLRRQPTTCPRGPLQVGPRLRDVISSQLVLDKKTTCAPF